MRAQVNRRLKQKTEDYDRLYREHKQAESDYKKRGVEFDRQLEKVKEQLKETRLDLAKTMDELDIKKEALSAEKTQAVERVKQLEAAAKEKLELTKTRNEEKERATYALNKLQDTYQKKVVEYESQAQAAAAIIVRLRQEKQEANARAQLGVDRIRLIMSAWRDRAQTSINECSEKVWKEWSQQAAELQTLRADAENRMKAGDKFYKMDEESIVTIREELSEDFFALVEEHLREIEGLVERLDDRQLETQLQLEKMEKATQTMEECWAKQDLLANVEADLDFHGTIVSACSNAMLKALYQTVRDQVTETQRQPIPITDPERMRESIAEHRKIIAALRANDGQSARLEMENHIRNTARCAGLSP